MSDPMTIQREIHAALHELLKGIDAIASNVAHLARSLEQEDRLRERAERADATERDDRHDAVIRTLKALHERLDDLHKTLPSETLTTIEKKIYELRIARWEAQQAGVGEPMPMPPVGYREPTNKFASARRDDETKPYARVHSDGEKRSVDEWIGGAVVFGFNKAWPYLLTACSTGGLIKLLHVLGAWR
jgi:hypothetical protein